MYWALTHDDDDYKNQEQETKDNYWLFPSLGIKIPIPFEIGSLFKVIPERIMALAFGKDTMKDFRDSMVRQLTSNLAVSPPQFLTPLLEVKLNHSFFTNRPIVGSGMENVEAKYQVTPSTTKAAIKIGEMTGLSPIMLEHVWQGYTGTLGMYAASLVDSMYSANSLSQKPNLRFEQLPVVKRFAIDPLASGRKSEFYDLKNSVDSVVRTSNFLSTNSMFKEQIEFTKDNMGLYATKEYVSLMEQRLSELRGVRRQYMQSTSMSGEEKKNSIAAVIKMEQTLLGNIDAIRANVFKSKP
jgi:hypothetical protein